MPSSTLAEQTSDRSLRTFAKNLNDFKNQLPKSLYSKEKNSVFSVLGVELLLGSLYAGAEEHTASQLAALIGVYDDRAETLSDFQQFIAALERSTARKSWPHIPEIKIAVRAYVAHDITLKTGFIRNCEEYLEIIVDQLDFAEKEESAEVINAWVETVTEKSITDLISPGDLSAQTRFLLLSAIYFKGRWEHPFKSYNTEDREFRISESRSIKVKQMFQVDWFYYAEDRNHRYLSMLYKNEKLSMLIILPKDSKSFENMNVSEIDVSSLEFIKRKVFVTLPKFQIESDIIDWIPILKSRIPSVFNLTANFNGMSDEPLYVTNIIQKAYIKVDEEGTESAAATDTTATASFGCALENFDDEGRYFTVDRPFYFAVVTDVAECPMFLLQGAVTNPTP